MATYTEIRNLFNSSDLKNRTAVAVIIAAQGIMDEAAPSTARKAWAAQAFASPSNEADRVLMSVLATNESATLTAIENASDALLQTNVNAAIDMFIDADAGV